MKALLLPLLAAIFPLAAIAAANPEQQKAARDIAMTIRYFDDTAVQLQALADGLKDGKDVGLYRDRIEKMRSESELKLKRAAQDIKDTSDAEVENQLKAIAGINQSYELKFQSRVVPASSLDERQALVVATLSHAEVLGLEARIIRASKGGLSSRRELPGLKESYKGAKQAADTLLVAEKAAKGTADARRAQAAAEKVLKDAEAAKKAAEREALSAKNERRGSGGVVVVPPGGKEVDAATLNAEEIARRNQPGSGLKMTVVPAKTGANTAVVDQDAAGTMVKIFADLRKQEGN